MISAYSVPSCVVIVLSRLCGNELKQYHNKLLVNGTIIYPLPPYLELVLEQSVTLRKSRFSCLENPISFDSRKQFCFYYCLQKTVVGQYYIYQVVYYSMMILTFDRPNFDFGWTMAILSIVYNIGNELVKIY